jgi:phosphate-selective porin OprO/OprP
MGGAGATTRWLVVGLSALAAPFRLAAEDEPAAPPVQAKAGADGFSVQSEDGAWKLRLGGYAQLDGRFYPGDDAKLGTDTFVLRRVRPIVQGTVARHFDFYINPDFGGGTTVLQDAYLDARFTPRFRVRAGKFKEPFGLERLASGTGLLFVERALPTALAPNRDLGIQLHGELAGGVLGYAAGVFNGVPDGGSVDTDVNDGKDLAGRIFLKPFTRGQGKALKNLGLGFAVTHGNQDGPLPSYKSGGQLTFFSYASGATAHGSRTRLSPQASWSYGPVGLIGEWVSSEQEVRRSATTPAVRLEHTAWQGAVAIVLTGEDATPGAIKPRKSFEPGKGWGALELVARVNGFDVDEAAFTGGLADRSRSASKARAWGLGLNWYLNRNVKQALTYERTTFTGGAAAGADRSAENALFIRSQVAF